MVGALVWAEEVQELAGFSPSGFDVAELSSSHQMLELCEDLLDWVQVWAVGRKEDQVRALGPDRGSGGLAFVAAQVDGVDAPDGICVPEWWCCRPPRRRSWNRSSQSGWT